MLLTPGGRINGPSFLVGRTLGIAGAGAILLALAGASGAGNNGQPATWVSWLKLILGILLLAGAVREWLARPSQDEEVATPRWMGALDGFGPVKAAGTGVVLTAVNLKNLFLMIAAAAARPRPGRDRSQPKRRLRLHLRPAHRTAVLQSPGQRRRTNRQRRPTNRRRSAEHLPSRPRPELGHVAVRQNRGAARSVHLHEDGSPSGSIENEWSLGSDSGGAPRPYVRVGARNSQTVIGRRGVTLRSRGGRSCRRAV
jgi:Sap, sulfolipid-1-addressing protein